MGHRNLLPGGARYYKRVLSVEPQSLIGYWPMWEPSGSIAYDISGNGRNGAYTGVTLGEPGIGDGRASPLFDGANDFNNIYSASLASEFNGAEGTVVIWVKVANAGILTDGIQHVFFNIQTAAGSYVFLCKGPSNYGLQLLYNAGGTLSNPVEHNLTMAGWVAIAGTWSKSLDQVKLFMGGVQQDTTKSGLGVWGGTPGPGSSIIGMLNTALQLPWSGLLGHCALWSKAFTPAQTAYLAKA